MLTLGRNRPLVLMDLGEGVSRDSVRPPEIVTLSHARQDRGLARGRRGTRQSEFHTHNSALQ